MPKLLGELLLEQQEPFVLEAYLLERGYTRMVKSPTTGGWINSFMEKWNSKQKTATMYRLSISSGTTKFHSSSDSNIEDTRRNEAETRLAQSMIYGRAVLAKEVCTEGKGKWGAVEDSKQLSPVSVLQETESDEGLPVKQRKSNLKESSQDEYAASISQHKSSVQELPRIVDLNSYSQYIINKRAMKHTKQLLIDCLREVTDYHRERETGREHFREILGADKGRKLDYEKVREWSQEPIDETNTVRLLHHDFIDGEKREDSEQQKMEISIEIEDAIFGDVINEMLIASTV